MILCIHCIHSRTVGLTRECAAPKNMTTSPVDGTRKSRYSPIFLREEDRFCGIAGAWFEAREQDAAEQARGAGI